MSLITAKYPALYYNRFFALFEVWWRQSLCFCSSNDFSVQRVGCAHMQHFCIFLKGCLSCCLLHVGDLCSGILKRFWGDAHSDAPVDPLASCCTFFLKLVSLRSHMTSKSTWMRHLHCHTAGDWKTHFDEEQMLMLWLISISIPNLKKRNSFSVIMFIFLWMLHGQAKINATFQPRSGSMSCHFILFAEVNALALISALLWSNVEPFLATLPLLPPPLSSL